MNIKHLDHLVLTVKEMEKSLWFYGEVLSMEIVTFGEGRKAAIFGNQKINFHQRHKEIKPHAKSPTPGSADLCFLTSSETTEVMAKLAEKGVEIELGPVKRTGATGPIESVYLRDPDGNLIEISTVL
ncbi:VOC family virulence protein [Shouchella clausii]|uniref:VOC family virulence protein n=2 Tax=Shouchella clausii TaxID=79880 RepID=A0A268S0M7_SHOCL|nr:VOC family protein [Shouchella clausii]PAD42442.1 VOC family virulence protein [Bacillus sp. 7520-S]MBU8597392.1 VOC family protein [Shouchella clausii]MCY1105055.1 VOC family protein [Shouchella clausii]PAE81106.1 VOC family virulence protein [Shouchella clausii]PAE93684.1 VOC family virulence protein [Shouchella clausii]